MATNYTYSAELWLQGRPTLHVIKTHLTNICTETICKPLTDTSYYGINGGFFPSDDYDTTPTGSSSICVDVSEIGNKITVNGKTFSKNHNYNLDSKGNRISKKTMVIYKDVISGAYKAAYRFTDSRYTISDEFPTFTQIIGGTSYTLEAWGDKAYYVPLQRTVLAWKGSYAYLIVTDIPQTIPGLKTAIEQLGLDPSNSIVLDGSGSSAMQCKEKTKKGSERHIFNMIRLKSTT